LFFVCAKILSSWLNTTMAAENAGRSFDEGLGDLLHVRTLLGGGVTEFVGTLQQHQNDVLHCYTGLLRVGGGDADIKAEPFDLRRGAAPLDQGCSSRASTVWALPWRPSAKMLHRPWRVCASTHRPLRFVKWTGSFGLSDAPKEALKLPAAN
jgi:hypothetical protein